MKRDVSLSICVELCRIQFPRCVLEGSFQTLVNVAVVQCSRPTEALVFPSTTGSELMRILRGILCTTMANSKFQYVKKFELPDALLQDTYLVARLDGHRFTRFTAEHGFTKPNDERGLLLMAEVSRRT